MRILGALSIALTLLAAAPGQAAGLRLVTGTDYPPFAGPELVGGGMATDLVTAAFQAAGSPIEPIEFLPWKRGYQAVLDGEFDATFPYADAPDARRRPVSGHRPAPPGRSLDPIVV
jgi:polar amino acid transport system substrate-binding protein